MPGPVLGTQELSHPFHTCSHGIPSSAQVAGPIIPALQMGKLRHGLPEALSQRTPPHTQRVSVTREVVTCSHSVIVERALVWFRPEPVSYFSEKKKGFFCLFHGSIKNDYSGLAGCSTMLCGLSQVLVHGSVLVLPVKERGLTAVRGWRGRPRSGGGWVLPGSPGGEELRALLSLSALARCTQAGQPSAFSDGVIPGMRGRAQRISDASLGVMLLPAPRPPPPGEQGEPTPCVRGCSCQSF